MIHKTPHRKLKNEQLEALRRKKNCACTWVLPDGKQFMAPVVLLVLKIK